MAEGAEAPLLRQQLLICHWIDGMREAERGAAKQQDDTSRLVSQDSQAFGSFQVDCYDLCFIMIISCRSP